MSVTTFKESGIRRVFAQLIIDRFFVLVRKLQSASMVNEPLDQRTASLILHFLRHFFLAHHREEQRQAFQLLEHRGLPADFGPLAALRQEHRKMNAFIVRLERRVEEWEAESFQSGYAFKDELLELALLAEEHAKVEKRILGIVEGASSCSLPNDSEDTPGGGGSERLWVTLLLDLEERIARLDRAIPRGIRVTSS